MPHESAEFHVGWMCGSFTIEYEDGGRTFFLRDEDGVLYFDSRTEAESHIKSLESK